MRRFLTPRWIVRHLIMIVLVAACAALGWWQIGRAAQGNALSFGYAFEWPVFALFVIFIWYREIRLELRGPQERQEEAPPAVPPPDAGPQLLSSVPVRRGPTSDAQVEEVDPQLRAYNEYLAWLNADPTRRPGDYPGHAPSGRGAA